MSQPELDQTDLLADLKEIGTLRDEDIPVAKAALLLGALDRPGCSLEPYFAHLDDLVSSIARIFEDPVLAGNPSHLGFARAHALSGVIGDEYGYGGDRISYDDVRNANLLDVIDRRKGLPVALGILYVHCAQSLGWELAGLGFPGHFVVGLRDGDEHIILDPFNGGRILQAHGLAELLQQIGGPVLQVDPAMIESIGNRDVLLRLENNIKNRLQSKGEHEKAADVIQRMVLIAPHAPDLWFELGEAHAQAGKLGAAIQALKNCLSKSPGQALKHDATLALDDLKLKLN